MQMAALTSLRQAWPPSNERQIRADGVRNGGPCLRRIRCIRGRLGSGTSSADHAKTEAIVACGKISVARAGSRRDRSDRVTGYREALVKGAGNKAALSLAARAL